MPARTSDKKGVCLSVKRVDCDKTEERSVQIFIRYEISFSVVFWEEEWLVGATPSTWYFGSAGPRWSEIADFEAIFACSASAVTPSEKVQLRPIKSRLCAFHFSHSATQKSQDLASLHLSGLQYCNSLWQTDCQKSLQPIPSTVGCPTFTMHINKRTLPTHPSAHFHPADFQWTQLRDFQNRNRKPVLTFPKPKKRFYKMN